MNQGNHRNAVSEARPNPALAGSEQAIDRLMLTRCLKEADVGGDIRIACISGARSELPIDGCRYAPKGA